MAKRRTPQGVACLNRACQQALRTQANWTGRGRVRRPLGGSSLRRHRRVTGIPRGHCNRGCFHRPERRLTGLHRLCDWALDDSLYGQPVGAFGFASIGAESDPSANLARPVLFASRPVSLAVIGTFGAFEVLASIYIPESVDLFSIMTGVAGFFAIFFTAASIPDALGLHPTTMGPDEYDDWRGRQWLQDRRHGVRVMYILIGACGGPVLVRPEYGSLSGYQQPWATTA